MRKIQVPPPLVHLVSGAQKVARRATWTARAALSGQFRSTGVEVVHHRPDPVDSTWDETVWQTSSTTVVEPRWGYLVVEPWQLHTTSFDPLQGDLPAWRYGTPPPLKWARARRRPAGRILEFDTVVSIRHFYEWNFYHFLMDTLPKLALLDELGIGTDAPVVVGPSVREQTFAREMVALGAFADRTWVVQEHDQYVRAGRVVVATPQLTHRARAEYLLRQVEPAIGPPDAGAKHRVFLIRRPPSRRFISNVDEVAEALRARGFRMVDAAEMSMRDQIELFRGTRHLVAIHGAGLTNLLWRAGQPMTVYELCTLPHRYSDDFLTMARELDFEFHRLEFENAPGCDPDVPDILVDLDELLPVVDAAIAREAEQQVEPEG